MKELSETCLGDKCRENSFVGYERLIKSSGDQNRFFQVFKDSLRPADGNMVKKTED